MSIAPASNRKSDAASRRSGLCDAYWQHRLQAANMAYTETLEFQLFQFVLVFLL
jgi:hypothetical protein